MVCLREFVYGCTNIYEGNLDQLLTQYRTLHVVKVTGNGNKLQVSTS